MNRHYGSQSMIAPLRTVMVRRPDEAFTVDDPGDVALDEPVDILSTFSYN